MRFCEPVNADPPVDHHQLAVVAQVGPLELAVEGRTGSIGWNRIAVFSSRATNSLCSRMLREPMWSKSSRTVTPRSAAATRASKNGAVTSSQAAM